LLYRRTQPLNIALRWRSKYCQRDYIAWSLEFHPTSQLIMGLKGKGQNWKYSTAFYVPQRCSASTLIVTLDIFEVREEAKRDWDHVRERLRPLNRDFNHVCVDTRE